jgi:tRNA-dihydrouridine synthase 3
MHDMNPEISKQFRGRVVLAPLTRGGNLPYRRLLLELGADVTTSEMAMSRHVVRGKRSEMALLRRAEEEKFFGVQLAGRHASELARATEIAAEHGADFVDLNLGCPIDLLCRRGLGAALLKKPRRVEEIVRAMVAATELPVTVKFRLGYDQDKPRYRGIAEAAVAGGATAITLHGRSRTQRYKRAADWEAVAELAANFDLPVIGNGDLLSWRDVEYRRRTSGCASVMLGRAALIKPWVFREIDESRDYLLDAPSRWDILRRFRELSLDHFGRDERGRTRVREFLVWHLDFYHRYRPEPSLEPDLDEHPRIQLREPNPVSDPQSLEGLLYSGDPEIREELADRLLAEETHDPELCAFWRENSAAVVVDRWAESEQSRNGAGSAA